VFSPAVQELANYMKSLQKRVDLSHITLVNNELRSLGKIIGSSSEASWIKKHKSEMKSLQDKLDLSHTDTIKNEFKELLDSVNKDNE
jgi:hypothetical protein